MPLARRLIADNVAFVLGQRWKDAHDRSEHPDVHEVRYPGLASHPQGHPRHRRDGLLDVDRTGLQERLELQAFE